MCGPDMLYLPHHYMGPLMPSPDTLYICQQQMAPRCQAQTRCTFPIT